MTSEMVPVRSKGHKKKGDRKSIPYTEELGRKICRAVSTSKEGLAGICLKNPEFPKKTLIYEWFLDHPEFREMYLNAKRCQAFILMEDIIEIADNDDNDTIVSKYGERTCNREWIQRSKLMVYVRQWIAGKLLKNIYGDIIPTENPEYLEALRKEVQSMRDIAQKCMKET